MPRLLHHISARYRGTRGQKATTQPKYAFFGAVYAAQRLWMRMSLSVLASRCNVVRSP